MGFLNLSSSLRYGPHGKKRKTKAFTKKKTKYNELILQQQKIYDQVVKEVAEEYPSLESTATGNSHHVKNHCSIQVKENCWV